jgi:hypothetical protein
VATLLGNAAQSPGSKRSKDMGSDRVGRSRTVCQASLWDCMVAQGWHPFLRVNLGSKAREEGLEAFELFSRWVPAPGTSWHGQMECFAGKASRLLATVLMHSALVLLDSVLLDA